MAGKTFFLAARQTEQVQEEKDIDQQVAKVS